MLCTTPRPIAHYTNHLTGSTRKWDIVRKVEGVGSDRAEGLSE
jgi:hypothetical protein